MNSPILRPDAMRPVVGQPRIADYPPGATYGPMFLRDFELVWMLRGVADWTCTDGRAMRLRPGLVLLVPPGRQHHFTWDQRRACRHAFLHFQLEPPCDWTGWPLFRYADSAGPLPGLLGYLLWLGNHTPPGWEQRVADVLALLLASFVDGPLPVSDTAVPEVVNVAIGHVRVIWSTGDLRPISLTELAAAASVSASYLARQFRGRFGMGFVTALEHLRLIRASTLLLRSNYSLAAIARTCGFADQYHFSRRFAARYGLAPSAYRKLGGNGEHNIALPDGRLRALAEGVWPS